jgi:hypothetical protein
MDINLNINKYMIVIVIFFKIETKKIFFLKQKKSGQCRLQQNLWGESGSRIQPGLIFFPLKFIANLKKSKQCRLR